MLSGATLSSQPTRAAGINQRGPALTGSQQRLPVEEEGDEDDRCDNDRDNDLDGEGALSDELANEVEQRKVEQKQIAPTLVPVLESD